MNEGENAERCHDTMFDCDAAVVVPHIFWDVTTSRFVVVFLNYKIKIKMKKKKDIDNGIYGGL